MDRVVSLFRRLDSLSDVIVEAFSPNALTIENAEEAVQDLLGRDNTWIGTEEDLEELKKLALEITRAETHFRALLRTPVAAEIPMERWMEVRSTISEDIMWIFRERDGEELIAELNNDLRTLLYHIEQISVDLEAGAAANTPRLDRLGAYARVIIASANWLYIVDLVSNALLNRFFPPTTVARPSATGIIVGAAADFIPQLPISGYLEFMNGPSVVRPYRRRFAGMRSRAEEVTGWMRVSQVATVVSNAQINRVFGPRIGRFVPVTLSIAVSVLGNGILLMDTSAAAVLLVSGTAIVLLRCFYLLIQAAFRIRASRREQFSRDFRALLVSAQGLLEAGTLNDVADLISARTLELTE